MCFVGDEWADWQVNGEEEINGGGGEGKLYRNTEKAKDRT